MAVSYRDTLHEVFLADIMYHVMLSPAFWDETSSMLCSWILHRDKKRMLARRWLDFSSRLVGIQIDDELSP